MSNKLYNALPAKCGAMNNNFFFNFLKNFLYYKINNRLDKNYIISKKNIIFLRPFSKKSIKNTLYKRLNIDVLKD